MTVIRPSDPGDKLGAYALGKCSAQEVDEFEAYLEGHPEAFSILGAVADDRLIGYLHRAGSETLGDSGDTPAPAGRPGATQVATPATSDGEQPAVFEHETQASDIAPTLSNHPRYCVLRRLGAGGMGAVFLAEHRLMHRQVALKLINPEFITSLRMIERFRQEIDAAARLHHPNIVSAFDAEEFAGVHFLAMEYVEGESLREYLDRQRTLPVAEACEYVRQAAVGLQHAYEKGMVHRDIKPHNMMRTPDGTIKILDFGLASLAVQGQSDNVTASGAVMGTPDYMAPEQAQDTHSADIRADIYGLGCTLYHLLTGCVPFPSRTNLDKLIAHRQQEPEALAKLRPEIPQRVATIVRRMMAKSLEERFQTPREVAEALSAWLAQETENRKGPPRKKRPVANWFMGAAAIVLLSGVVIIIRQNGKETKLDVPAGTKILVKKDGGIEIDAPQDNVEAKIKDNLGVGEVRRFEGHTDIIWGIAISPDDRFLLSTSNDRTIRQWDLRTGKYIRSFLGHGDHTVAASFSPDGKHFLSASQDGSIRRWSMETGRRVDSFFGDFFTDVVYSPDGRRALSASMDGNEADGFVRLWDMEEWKQLRIFKGHKGRGAQRVTFSPNGQRALSSGHDGTVRLWDVETGRELQKIEGALDGGVAFSPNGRSALYSAKDSSMGLWDVDAAKDVRRFRGHQGGVSGTAFSHNGARALSSGSTDKTVHLWDVATGRELHCFHGHSAFIYKVLFTHDDRYAVSSSHDKTVRVWRLPDPAPEKTDEVRRFGEPTHAVIRLAVSRDGNHVLTAGTDGCARYWDVATGKLVHRLASRGGPVNDVAISADGKKLLSCGNDSSIHVWDAATGAEICRPQ